MVKTKFYIFSDNNFVYWTPYQRKSTTNLEGKGEKFVVLLYGRKEIVGI